MRCAHIDCALLSRCICKVCEAGPLPSDRARGRALDSRRRRCVANAAEVLGPSLMAATPAMLALPLSSVVSSATLSSLSVISLMAKRHKNHNEVMA